MYYGSDRATAIAISTMLLALLLASSFASIPIVQGQTATVSPKDYPIFCDSTGALTFTFDTGGQTWYGVAIEVPKVFKGLVHGDISPIRTDIIQDIRFIYVYDEEIYPYYRPYFWVQVCIPKPDYPTWPGITGSKTITLLDIKAPSVARDYKFNVYYTGTYFPCTYLAPTDFSTGRGTALPSVTVKVHMREEGSIISGTVSDTTYSPSQPLNDGFVTATAADGPLKGKVVAKTAISSTGAYTLTGLYNGTYKLRAWGTRTAVDVFAAYIPTELPLPVTVGRRATLTGVNIAVTRGGEISGSVKLYDGTSVTTPATVFAGSFSLPGTGPGGTPALPVRLELYDAAKTLVWYGTVNVPETASSVSYSIKDLFGEGISAGTYTLKGYAFGFIQTADVTVSVSAPGVVTIDVPLVKGGGITGTLYYLTPQGTTTTLASGQTILVEVFDAAGALKGVWIGTTTAGVTSTTFTIRGAGESITPVAPTDHSTVSLKTYSGRKVLDGGLADGGYTIKVSVAAFVQPTPYPTAVISYAGTGTASIYLKAGGTISGTIYAKDPTGVYAENWARTGTASVYVYDAAGASVGSQTVNLVSTASTTTFSFTGTACGASYLQAGSKQTALADGTYTIKVFTLGYTQATPYPTATIYTGGAQSVDCIAKRGGAIIGTLTFKEAGVTIPGGITGLVKVEAIDAAGVTKGAAFYSITTAATQLSYSIYGLYKFGTALDGGLVDGTYTVKVTLSDFTHLTQTAVIAGGGTATLNFDVYRMGVVTGTIRGAVTYQAAPVPLSGVKITLTGSPVIYTTYSKEGTYSIRVPDGTYTMVFSASGYKPYTVTVTVASGTTQEISADLVETFERIPEFPIGAVFTLAASLGLALCLLRWIRKPIATTI